MSATSLVIAAAERLPIPDALTRRVIAGLVERADGARDEENDPAHLAADMAGRPIAEHADAANAQHYEVPAEFFRLVLGPRLKYSSGLYEPGDTLAAAEERALAQTCEHAGLADGQRILELGCGWGSLSLWMAERYPAAQIISVSNSASQRSEIEARARHAGFANLEVVTADMNDFAARGQFDRVVSVEMFEHMSNWRALLQRVGGWLEADGRLFLHVFSHRQRAYRFDAANDDDWIGRHFFTGGLMPSDDLIGQFGDLFTVEARWRWNGRHYQRTAVDWLANFDANRRSIRPILNRTYGADAGLWERRWRLFFLATAGLFGARGGETWGVSHWRLRLAEIPV